MRRDSVEQLRRNGRWLGVLLLCLLFFSIVSAQPAQLPSELFVLTADGVVEQYGVLMAGARQITPEAAFVVDFGVDALGDRLAYRTEDGLYVLPLSAVGESGAAGVQVEGDSASVPPFRGAGKTIAWSPDGDALAYTTLNGGRVYIEAISPVFLDLTEGEFINLSWSPAGTFLAAETADHIWWIYRREGATISLASVIPSSIGTAWVSNSEIVFVPAEGGLKLMNLDAANAQTTLLDESVEYRLPYLTLNDQLVFFSRPKGSASIPPDFGVLLRLSRGASQVETIGRESVSLSGLQWAPGGEVMTALQGGALALVNPLTGEGVTLTVNNAVAFDWQPLRLTPILPPTLIPTLTPLPSATPVDGVQVPLTIERTADPLAPRDVTGLTLSSATFFLAPDTSGVVQVWLLPADGSPALRFTAARTSITEFAASPNSRSVAYVSDSRLWVQRIEGGQPFAAAVLNGAAPATPTFSPDGTRIAYVDETATTGGIWFAYTDGTPAARALTNISDVANPANSITYRQPQFAPEGNRLLLQTYRVDRVTSVVFDVEGGTLTALPSDADLDARPLTARWLRDGRVLTYSDAAITSDVSPGLYIYEVDEAEEPPRWIPLSDGVIVRDVVQVTGETFRALLVDGPDAAVRVVDVTGLEQEEVSVVDGVLAPRLSPDGRFIAGYQTLVSLEGVLQGPLLFVDIGQGGRFRLSQPPLGWGLRWVD